MSDRWLCIVYDMISEHQFCFMFVCGTAIVITFFCDTRQNIPQNVPQVSNVIQLVIRQSLWRKPIEEVTLKLHVQSVVD